MPLNSVAIVMIVILCEAVPPNDELSHAELAAFECKRDGLEALAGAAGYAIVLNRVVRR